MSRFVLTQGADTVVAPSGRNAILAGSDTLSAGDVIVAGPHSASVLVLQDGNRFDLSAPSVLLGIDAVYDRSFGDSVITLRDGLDLTLHLGGDSATVYGANNADTVIGGSGGFTTFHVGSAHERFLAGSGGARVFLDATTVGARIGGTGLTSVTLTGRYGDAVTLGREIQGVGELDLVRPGLGVALRGAGIATVALSASHIALSLDAGTRSVTDYAGGNLIRFAGAGQTLVLPYASLIPGLPADRLTGFHAGDAVDIDLPFETGEVLSYDAATGQTVIREPYGASETLYLDPGLSGLRLSADAGLPNGDRGTLLTLAGAPSPPDPVDPPQAPCFAAGTRILAARGWIAVEDLRTGERLVTGSGRRRALRWLGHRAVECRRHPYPALVWPVRVRAGAFDDALPAADVLLSPDHAVWLRGVLVPIKYLVNGATIVQEQTDRVHYFHLELGSHDVLLAEGLPVESYLDTGNRHQFANGGAALGLHPDFSRCCAATGFAPLTTGGPAVREIRAGLLTRAHLQGYGITQDADLTVIADGQRIWGRFARGIWTGWIPPGAAEIRLRSRAAAPADCDLNSDDLRRLGVALNGITMQAGTAARRLGPDDLVWGDGFHPAERDAHACWRWTNGDALLTPRLWAGLEGPLRLDLHLFRTISYRLDEASTNAQTRLRLASRAA